MSTEFADEPTRMLISKRRKSHFQTVFAAILAILVAQAAAVAPGWAEDSSLNDELLLKCEVALWKTAQSGSDKERLERLEKEVFGKSKGGGLENRLDNVAELLRVSKDKAVESPALVDKPTDQGEPEQDAVQPKVATPAGTSENKESPKLEQPEKGRIIVEERKANEQKDVQPKQSAKPVQTPLHKKEGRPPQNIVLEKQVPQSDVPPLAPPIRKEHPLTHAPERNGSQQGSALSDVLRLGVDTFARGNTEEAERCFRHVLMRDPRNVDALYNLGAIAERRGDWISALTNYRSAWQIAPFDPTLRDAVMSMESNLNKQATSQPPLEVSDFGRVGQPPVLPVTSNKTFQLQSSQNALGTSQSGGAAPVLPVRQGSRKSRAAGALLSIGVNCGLSAAGLHCPACRILPAVRLFGGW